MSLYTDIILVVMSLAPRVTVSALSRTCKFLHGVGVKRLLEMGVDVKGEAGIDSFIQFMLADSAERFPRLLRLSIHSGLIDSTVGHKLALLIPKASALRTLRLSCAEELLYSDPSLGPAFSSLPSLEVLTANSCDELAFAMLYAIKSPLKRVRLLFKDVDDDEDEDYVRNPLLCLRPAQDTLVALTVDNATISTSSMLLTRPYPLVKTFKWTEAWEVRIVPLIHAFPNLASLALSTVHSGEGDCYLGLRDNFDAWRARNRREQQTHGTWAGLEQYSGTLLDLYIAAPTCPIKSLSLSFGREDVVIFNTVLADVRPVELNIRVAERVFKDGAMKTAFAGAGCTQIRVLRVDMDLLNTQRRTHDVEALLQHIAASIGPLSLEELNLSMDCKGQLPYNLRAESLDRAPSPTENSLRNMDLNAYARGILTSSDTLQSVIINVTNHRGLRVSFVKAERE